MTHDLEDTAISDRGECRVPEGTRRAWLTMLAGPYQGKQFPLPPGVTLIGRSPAADVVIADDLVSRVHTELSIYPDGTATIRDCGSTNGTMLGSCPVTRTPRELRDGARIQVGGAAVLRFSFKDHVEEHFERRLYDSATRDALTGVHNRRHFHEQLDQAFARALRSAVPLGLIVFDLDGFKEINDRLGHAAGDHVLRVVAVSVADSLRRGESIARFGGDEFTVTLSRSTIEEALICAERLRRMISSLHVTWMSEELQVTASFGVTSTSRGSFTTGDELFGEADESLYRAKTAGRNRVCGSRRS